MGWSVVIGVVVVLVAGVGMGPLLFGEQAEPATVPVRAGSGSTARGPQRPAPQPRRPQRADRTSLPVRCRGVVGLVLLCAGIGAAIAVVVGTAVFLVGISLQG